MSLWATVHHEDFVICKRKASVLSSGPSKISSSSLENLQEQVLRPAKEPVESVVWIEVVLADRRS